MGRSHRTSRPQPPDHADELDRDDDAIDGDGPVIDVDTVIEREIPPGLVDKISEHLGEIVEIRVQSIRARARTTLRRRISRDPKVDEREPDELALAVLRICDQDLNAHGPVDSYLVELRLGHGAKMEKRWCTISPTYVDGSGGVVWADSATDPARGASSTIAVALELIERVSREAQRSLAAVVASTEGYVRVGQTMTTILDGVGSRYIEALEALAGNQVAILNIQRDMAADDAAHRERLDRNERLSRMAEDILPWVQAQWEQAQAAGPDAGAEAPGKRSGLALRVRAWLDGVRPLLGDALDRDELELADVAASATDDATAANALREIMARVLRRVGSSGLEAWQRELALRIGPARALGLRRLLTDAAKS
jgi:hypothetical protein